MRRNARRERALSQRRRAFPSIVTAPRALVNRTRGRIAQRRTAAPRSGAPRRMLTKSTGRHSVEKACEPGTQVQLTREAKIASDFFLIGAIFGCKPCQRSAAPRSGAPRMPPDRCRARHIAARWLRRSLCAPAVRATHRRALPSSGSFSRECKAHHRRSAPIAAGRRVLPPANAKRAPFPRRPQRGKVRST